MILVRLYYLIRYGFIFLKALTLSTTAGVACSSFSGAPNTTRIASPMNSSMVPP